MGQDNYASESGNSYHLRSEFKKQWMKESKSNGSETSRDINVLQKGFEHCFERFEG